MSSLMESTFSDLSGTLEGFYNSVNKTLMCIVNLVKMQILIY